MLLVRTLGSVAPVPSLTVELPTYVVRQNRGNRTDFYF